VEFTIGTSLNGKSVEQGPGEEPGEANQKDGHSG
jgi:hypothetical protein